MNSRKARGSATERIVSERLKAVWPFNHVVRGNGPDLQETPGYAVEIKARTRLDLPEWMRQAKRHSAKRGGIPLLVIRLNGQGPASVDDFPVVMRLGDFIDLVRE